MGSKLTCKCGWKEWKIWADEIQCCKCAHTIKFSAMSWITNVEAKGMFLDVAGLNYTMNDYDDGVPNE